MECCAIGIGWGSAAWVGVGQNREAIASHALCYILLQGRENASLSVSARPLLHATAATESSARYHHQSADHTPVVAQGVGLINVDSVVHRPTPRLLARSNSGSSSMRTHDTYPGGSIAFPIGSTESAELTLRPVLLDVVASSQQLISQQLMPQHSPGMSPRLSLNSFGPPVANALSHASLPQAGPSEPCVADV